MTLSFVRWRMSGSKPAELAAGPVGHLLPAGLAVAGRPGLAGELGERHRVGGGAARPGGPRAARGGPGRGAGPRGRRRPAASAAGAATRRRARGRRRRARAPAATAPARPRRARSAGRAPCRASACIAGTASRIATDWNEAIRARPATLPAAAASSASATLGPLEQRLGVARRARAPASVRRTPRPARSSSGTPASRSSTASCWETAEGVNWSASATAAIVPRACSSCSRRRRWRSSMHKQRY